MAEPTDGAGAGAGSTSAFVSRFLEGLEKEAPAEEPRAREADGDDGHRTQASIDGGGDAGQAEDDEANPGSGPESGAAPTEASEEAAQSFNVTVDGQERTVSLAELQAGYRQFAEVERALAAQRAALASEAMRSAESIESLREQVARQAGIKSAEEIQKLHDEGKYSEWVVAREQRRAFEEQLEAGRQRTAQALAAAQVQAIDACWRKVPELVPEWRDLEASKAEIQEVGGYLVAQGVPAGDVGRITNPLVWPIARKAMLYDRLQEAKPAVTKRVAEAPRMQKAGTARSRQGEESERYAADRERLKKSGKVEDAARLFRRLV